jgi:hypothetical protein
MMHYYFHIRTEGRVVLDEEGLSMPDLQAARTELRASASDLATAEMRAGRTAVGTIEIEDETGNLIETLAIRQMLQ